MVNTAYESLRVRWKSLSTDECTVLLDRFKVGYSFNSGSMENPAITYHETAEIFDKNGVSNFTGDVRTIFEIANLKRAWSWLMNRLRSNTPFDTVALLDAHRVLTAGTYDEDRWSKGERPGAFKLGDYRIAGDVGYAPEDVAVAIDDLLEEVATAMDAPNANHRALTIAAYAHAKLVDIHPFADGNGRLARLSGSWIEF